MREVTFAEVVAARRINPKIKVACRRRGGWTQWFIEDPPSTALIEQSPKDPT